MGLEKKAAKPPVPVPNLKEVIPERTDEYLHSDQRRRQAVGLSAFMPALGFNLSDQEIQHLISYLRSLNQKNQKEGAFFKEAQIRPGEVSSLFSFMNGMVLVSFLHFSSGCF